MSNNNNKLRKLLLYTPASRGIINYKMERRDYYESKGGGKVDGNRLVYHRLGLRGVCSNTVVSALSKSGSQDDWVYTCPLTRNR